jgi:hypothetical protein
MNFTEEYRVKFWFTNKEGFREQGEEFFKASSKDAHKLAASVIEHKWLRERGQHIEIISVKYQ